MSTDKNIFYYSNKKPVIDKSCFIAPGSRISGDVIIGKKSSVWFNAVIRADQNTIRIGNRSNIQDNCVLHVDPKNKCVVKDNVSIGHNAIVHACTIESNCIIGMGSIILSGSRIGRFTIIGAGSVVTENEKIPPKSLVLGIPGKVIRKLKQNDIDYIKKNAEEYLELMKNHKRN